VTTALVLASSSPYRRQLLERLRLDFQTGTPAIDETPAPGETGENLVLRLAESKARALATRYPSHLIIGSDQVATLGETILGKPGNLPAAQGQLKAQSGRRVSFYTGVAVIDSQTGRVYSDIDRTVVQFRQLPATAVSRYLEREKPFDCAGSFKCEGLGISLFDAIKTDDPTALTGLPLIKLCQLLRKHGLEIP
jgi:MAF protein